MCFYKSSALNFYESYLYFSLAETYLLRESMIKQKCVTITAFLTFIITVIEYSGIVSFLIQLQLNIPDKTI